MNVTEERLKKYIFSQKIDAQHLTFSQSCHSAQDAAKAVNADIDELIKSICLISSNGDLIVAIVRGDDSVSTKSIAILLNTERPRIATRDEVVQKTGYPAGGVPAFGYVANFLIDEKVMEKEVIYSGGGSENALIKISPIEMQRANSGMIARIRK